MIFLPNEILIDNFIDNFMPNAVHDYAQLIGGRSHVMPALGRPLRSFILCVGIAGPILRILKYTHTHGELGSASL